VQIHCRGWLTNGTLVDDTRARQAPVQLTLGAGELITGFDEGLVGMRVGGRRRLIVPSDLAFGAEGHKPTIPPYATLIYDVEILAIG
jgi:peptidylprolyl isomerase